jgi:hypothetical protein
MSDADVYDCAMQSATLNPTYDDLTAAMLANRDELAARSGIPARVGGKIPIRRRRCILLAAEAVAEAPLSIRNPDAACEQRSRSGNRKHKLLHC